MIQGSLGRLHLGDLLQWLQMGTLTGRLTLTEGGRERRLDFVEGRVVFVSSLVPRERLGTWLARQSVAPPGRLRQLLGASLLRRTLYTDSLIGTGAVSIEGLRTNLTELARTIVTRVLLAGEVRFAFDPEFPVRDLLNLDLDLEPTALVMEAARRTDESVGGHLERDEEVLPFRGEAFERFFWDLIREGVSGDEPLDGEQVVALHQIVRDVMATLAQWLAASPGLVPVPAAQVDELSRLLPPPRPIPLEGFPHLAWNQMVLACSIQSTDLPRPETMAALELEAHQLDLWLELTQNERLCRPRAGRLDDLTRRAALVWSRAAAAAAPYLELEPDAGRLAAHLLPVPTDLVLWVLATLPVPHQRLRQTILRRLPQRVGTALALRAGFPPALTQLWSAEGSSRLGVCLNLARDLLPSAPLWPAAVPDDESRLLLEVVSPSALFEAASAARRAVEDIPVDPATVG